jgi:hypothetical protein
MAVKQKSVKKVPKKGLSPNATSEMVAQPKVETRKSGRLQGKKLPEEILQHSPAESKVKATKRVRQDSDEATETKEQKRARLLRELDEMNEESEVDVPESEGEATKVAHLLKENAELKAKVSHSHQRRAKLERPTSFSGDQGKFRSWTRAIYLWRNLHSDCGDETMGPLLVQALTDDALDVVTCELSTEDMGSYEKVLACLEGGYGDDELIEALNVEEDYLKFRRESCDLGKFLTLYDAKKKRAERHGHKMSELTAGSTLLKKAEVSAQVRSNIVAALSSQGNTMLYSDVLKQLRSNARAAMLVADDDGTARVAKKALLAQGFQKGKSKGMHMTAAKGDGKGPGKGPYGGQRKVCWFNLQGNCRKGDSCIFSHDTGQKAFQTLQIESALIASTAYKKGKAKGQKGAKGTGKGPQWREGDWSCPSCSDHQFASNTQCRKCGARKPAEAAGPSKNRK